MACVWAIAVLVALCLVDVGLGVSLPDVCQYCPGKVRADGVERCSEDHGVVEELCCLRNEFVIGLDLSSCNISTLAENTTIFQDISASVEWIDLSNTSLQDFTAPPFSVNHVPKAFLAFQNLSNLTQVLMPTGNDVNYSCPGPEKAWQNISISNDTSKLVCQNPVLACSARGEMVYFRNNSACDKRSSCFPNGPGFRRCECKDGYYGYRCLRKGSFPVLAFSISVGAIVVTSIVLSQVYKCRRGRKILTQTGHVQQNGR